MIKSLNEAYRIDKEKRNFAYLCNACGDINDPSVRGDMAFHLPEDVMTPQEQELYYNFFYEGRYGCNLYVMRIDDQPYMAGCFLYSEDWCKDSLREYREKAGQVLPADEEAEEEVALYMPALFEAVKSAAERAEKQLNFLGFNFVDIYVGDYTDPVGHEILFTVHYNELSLMDNIYNFLDSFVDKIVMEEFTKLLAASDALADHVLHTAQTNTHSGNYTVEMLEEAKAAGINIPDGLESWFADRVALVLTSPHYSDIVACVDVLDADGNGDAGRKDYTFDLYLFTDACPNYEEDTWDSEEDS